MIAKAQLVKAIPPSAKRLLRDKPGLALSYSVFGLGLKGGLSSEFNPGHVWEAQIRHFCLRASGRAKQLSRPLRDSS